MCVCVIGRVTREHRENLTKLAKQFSNKAKESVRRVRSNALAQVKRSKEGVSEDTIHLIEKQVRGFCIAYSDHSSGARRSRM